MGKEEARLLAFEEMCAEYDWANTNARQETLGLMLELYYKDLKEDGLEERATEIYNKYKPVE